MDFGERLTPRSLNSRRRSRGVSTKGGSAGRHRVVLPYVQKYEFEALLFSDVACFGQLRDAPDGLVASLRKIRDEFATPEEIDDGAKTAPSTRIRALMPRYDKIDQGEDIALRIGLPTMRAECPRFDAWVRRLEALGTERATIPD